MTKPVTTTDHIVIRGARTHNLKNIDVSLPQEQLIVVTGVSGSGKSSLAFDTVYAEGQRRYVESLSAYARQFLERMEKPDVDQIEGICPAIAIRQKNSLRNPRSTVGTTTEIHDYLRLLFARIGRTICRQCGKEVIQETAEVAAKDLLALPGGTKLLIGFDMPVVSAPLGAENDANANDDEVVEQSESRPSAREKGRTKAGSSKRNRRNASDETVRQIKAGSDPIAGAIESLRRKGFGRLYFAGHVVSFDDLDPESLKGEQIIQVVVDRVKMGPELLTRLTDSIETAYQEGGGDAFAIELGMRSSERDVDAEVTQHRFSEKFECRSCQIQYELPQPRLFSFNSPFGACQTCHGFGNVIELDMNLVVPDRTKSINKNAIEPWSKPHYRSHLTSLKRAARGHGVRMSVPWEELTDEERRFVIEGDGQSYKGIQGFFQGLERKKYKVHVRVFLSRYRGYLTCPKCGGARLRQEARDVHVCGRTIDEICALAVSSARSLFDEIEFNSKEAVIVERVIREIRRRLQFLSDVGLDYLTLERLSSTLSGGEAQRINLATSLGSSLVGTLYVLDEPTIGLHPRDNDRLIRILVELRKQGNTVLVVEHDAEMIRCSDYVVDLGLGAGTRGGKVVFAGPYKQLANEATSLTAKYLRGDLAIPVPVTRKKRLKSTQHLSIVGASEHNLKDLDVDIPLGMLTCVTGVSGSGKSTLVHDVMYAAIKRAKGNWDKRVGAHESINGIELLNDVILVDQTPIGRTPRSNPVTYLKAFDPIRELFAKTKDARARGLSTSHFSFNVPGGRCDACEGEGELRVEMQFLADVFVPCEHCDGKRFKSQVLEVTYLGRRVDQVLDMTVREALQFFSSSPKVIRRLQMLDEIGLGYLRLGQPATTLSGGEAQRIKIAAHLGARHSERSLYIFDEPTTGLHFDDIAKLLAAFKKLVAVGHTLLVIEHNLDVVKTADWIIDLGPEGGEAGGHLVVAGPPERVAEHAMSHTGRYLQDVLANSRTHAYADS
jgi:excinuclease ABC subunit A